MVINKEMFSFGYPNTKTYRSTLFGIFRLQAKPMNNINTFLIISNEP